MNARWTRIGAAALVLVAGVSAALSGDVDIKKNRDTRVTVWRTVLGFRVGDPVYDGVLPAWHRLRVRSHWLTDLSVRQEPVGEIHSVEYSIAAFEGPPGMVEMVPLEAYIRDRFGNEVPTIVDFFTGPLGPPHDLYVGLAFGEGVPLYPTQPLDTVVPVQNGTALGWEGYLFSRVPLRYQPGIGWVSDQPYTGQVQIVGEITLNADPYLPNGCNWADLAEPYEILDLADISAFIEAFVGGCPPDDW